jgi:hypothetical protein
VSGGVNFYKTDPLIELDGKAPNPVAVLSNKYDYYIIPPKTTLYMVVTPASEGSTQGNIDLTLVFQKTGAKPGDPEYQLAIYQTWQSSLRRFSDPDFEETPGGAKVVVNPDAYQGAGVRSPNVVTGPGNGSGTFITIEP